MSEHSAYLCSQARRNLENARYEAQGRFFEWACFSAQQAAEMALKAILHRQSVEPAGHGIVHLLKIVSTDVPTELYLSGTTLDKFYFPERFPAGWTEGAPGEFITEEDSQIAIECAEGILGFCLGLLDKGDGKQ